MCINPLRSSVPLETGQIICDTKNMGIMKDEIPDQVVEYGLFIVNECRVWVMLGI